MVKMLYPLPLYYFTKEFLSDFFTLELFEEWMNSANPASVAY